MDGRLGKDGLGRGGMIGGPVWDNCCRIDKCRRRQDPRGRDEKGKARATDMWHLACGVQQHDPNRDRFCTLHTVQHYTTLHYVSWYIPPRFEDPKLLIRCGAQA